MSAHTPWQVGGKTPDRTDAYFPENVRDITAYLGGGVTMVIAREVEADDARLIAAAPELLTALQSVLSHDTEGFDAEACNDCMAECRAALAKAGADE